MHEHKHNQCKRKVKHRKNVMKLIIFCITVGISLMFIYYQNLRKDTTERPEGVEAGTLKLAGTKMEDIYRECRQLLTEPEIYRRMSEARNPYGDGTASIKIRKILENIDA